MRVALLADNYPGGLVAGGIGSYVRVLGRELAAMGHDVHVFAFGAEGARLDGGLSVHLIAPWSRRRDLPLKALLDFERHGLEPRDLNAFQLFRVLAGEARRSGAFDIVESPEFGGLGRFLVGRREVARKLAVRLHGPASSLRGAGSSPWAGMRQDPERSLALSADVLTAPSYAAVSLCEETWSVKLSAHVIGNPVERPFGTYRQSVSGADVLYVGRLELLKGVDMLADMLSVLPESVKVRVAGADMPVSSELTGLEMLKASGHEFEYVGVLGPDELRREIAAAKVVVLPSRQETFGLVLVEAMSVGAAVIAADITAFREISEGESAMLLPTNEPAKWAEAVCALLGEPCRRQELGMRAEIRARKWSADIVAREILKIWSGAAQE